MKFDGEEAKSFPLIKDFVDTVQRTKGSGHLDFRDLQRREFMKFWKNLVIYNYEESLNDFRVVFYGTHLVEMYGRDWTGKTLSEMGFAEVYQDVLDMNLRVLKDEPLLYANGTLFWKNQEYRTWHQVKMPLQRKGKINEVLMCMGIS